MTITIKDIAKIAGVSHSTVSRSLNDSPLISEQTKTKIKNIAKELDFEFNSNARGLTTNKTGTIGLIYPEYFERFNINLFFGSLQSQVRNIFEKEGIDIIVSFPKNSFTGESNIQKLIGKKKIDGLIIINNEISQYDLNFIKESGIPYLFLHKQVLNVDVEDSDYFCTDHFYGGYIAANHLIKVGRRNIMCISAIGEEFDSRLKGYKAALSDSDIKFDESLVFYGDCSFEYGTRVVMENQQRMDRIDGIFAQTDIMALGVIQGLKNIGKKVPEDISVIGYDDIELGTYFSPRLTTVHQPREQLASLACNRMIELLKSRKKKFEHKIIKPSLIIRESCGGRKVL